MILCGLLLTASLAIPHTASAGNWWDWWMYGGGGGSGSGGGSGGSGGGGGNAVPLDGGLSLLLIAGAGYGLKRFAANAGDSGEG